MLWEDANVGIIEEISPSTPLLGAENNGKVTCYLDSLLFALYARLDSFEVGDNCISIEHLLANLV